MFRKKVLIWLNIVSVVKPRSNRSNRDYVVSKLEKIEKYFQAEQELDARVNLKVYREKLLKWK